MTAPGFDAAAQAKEIVESCWHQSDTDPSDPYRDPLSACAKCLAPVFARAYAAGQRDARAEMDEVIYAAMKLVTAWAEGRRSMTIDDAQAWRAMKDIAEEELTAAVAALAARPAAGETP